MGVIFIGGPVVDIIWVAPLLRGSSCKIRSHMLQVHQAQSHPLPIELAQGAALFRSKKADKLIHLHVIAVHWQALQTSGIRIGNAKPNPCEEQTKTNCHFHPWQVCRSQLERTACYCPPTDQLAHAGANVAKPKESVVPRDHVDPIRSKLC